MFKDYDGAYESLSLDQVVWASNKKAMAARMKERGLKRCKGVEGHVCDGTLTPSLAPPQGKMA